MSSNRTRSHTIRPQSKPISLKALSQRLETLEEQALRLRKQLRMARGTETPPTGVKSPPNPFWIGDEGSTEELIETIGAAITDRPRSLQELIELTGARRNRVSGALVRLQFTREVQNLGTATKAFWFLPPARPNGTRAPEGSAVRLRITLGARVSTDESGYLGVVTGISGTTDAPVYTVMTDDGQLITPDASKLKLTRGRVPGKTYGKGE